MQHIITRKNVFEDFRSGNETIGKANDWHRHRSIFTGPWRPEYVTEHRSFYTNGTVLNLALVEFTTYTVYVHVADTCWSASSTAKPRARAYSARSCNGTFKILISMGVVA